MRKLGKFLFQTWYGASVGWCASGVFALLFYLAFGVYRSLAWSVLTVLAAHVLVGLVVLSAVIYSLVKKRWLRAFVQFLLAVASAALFVWGLVTVALAVMFSERNMEDFERTEQPWYGTAIGEQLPFAVEYQAAHPFLAEYHKRISFKSGKHVEVTTDTGGAADFAVYVLTDGRYYLVDGLSFDELRNEYRVDPKVETVEQRGNDRWERLPDYSRSPDTVADSLESKRFLGTVKPTGDFIPGGEDPIP